MPNWVTNRVTFNGSKESLRVVRETVFDHESKNPFSLNAIRPMPDYIYKGNVGRDEFEKYGKNNWYDWSVENWGTKWDVDSPEVIIDRDDELEYVFQTAWSTPARAMEYLRGRIPKDVSFKVVYADEDLGSNCGEYYYDPKNGFEEWYPDDNEAYEFACDVWGYDPNEWE